MAMRHRWPLARAWVCWLALLEGVWLPFTLAAQETLPMSPALVPVDTARLLQIERRLLPLAIVPGPAAHSDLPAYYAAANSALVERLSACKQVYESGTGRPVRRITFISGDAGVGKTFIKGHAFRKDYPAGAVCKFDLHELYEEWLSDGRTEARPDLHDGDVVLNRLLAVKDQNRPLLREFLADRPAAIYVMDSLDEVHPDDYGWLFQQLERFVFSGGRDFVHVVVLGRPLAFHRHWEPLAQRHAAGEVELHSLKPPQFRTTGDVLVSTWNYLEFRHKLRWRTDGGDGRPLELREFEGWRDTGFARSGPNSNIALDNETPHTVHVHGTLEQWARNHRVLGPPLRNLAGNGLLREIVERSLSKDATRAFDEREFMDAFLQAWLERDTQSDDRPSLAKPEYLDLYVELLQRVAVGPGHPDRLDDEGYFEVRAGDRIEVNRYGRRLSFAVEGILNRSGMKHLDLGSGSQTVSRYRFEPIWFHRLLVDMHNERLRLPRVTRTTAR